MDVLSRLSADLYDKAIECGGRTFILQLESVLSNSLRISDPYDIVVNDIDTFLDHYEGELFSTDIDVAVQGGMAREDESTVERGRSLILGLLSDVRQTLNSVPWTPIRAGAATSIAAGVALIVAYSMLRTPVSQPPDVTLPAIASELPILPLSAVNEAPELRAMPSVVTAGAGKVTRQGFGRRLKPRHSVAMRPRTVFVHPRPTSLSPEPTILPPPEISVASLTDLDVQLPVEDAIDVPPPRHNRQLLVRVFRAFAMPFVKVAQGIVE
jgi:hypothetical protein